MNLRRALLCRHPAWVALLVCWGVWVTGVLCAAAPAFRLVRSFGDADRNGTLPMSKLTIGADGRLYGVTFRGGRNNEGTLYVINKDGTGYRAVHHFGGSDDGMHPSGALLSATDGWLYGTTTSSSAGDKGVVYRFDPATGVVEMVKRLEGPEVVLGRTGVIEGSDGALYGVADGSTTNATAVFRLNKDGTGYRILRSLPRADFDFAWSRAPLLEGSDGMLYGTGINGGTNNRGFLFKLSKDGREFKVMYSFGGTASAPQSPAGGVIEGADGQLYGQLKSGSGPQGENEGAIYRISRTGTGFGILHLFSIYTLSRPVGELVEGADGRFYGATEQGRSESGGVFVINKDGSGFTSLLTPALYQFPGFTPTLVDNTTIYGVASSVGSELGFIYRLPMTSGAGSILQEITPTGGSAVEPIDLLDASDKWIYGLTDSGRTSSPYFYRIRRDGSEYTPLRQFIRDDTGQREPYALSAEDEDGSILAPSIFGGAKGGGALVRLSRDGAYSFAVEFGTSFQGPGPSSPGGVLRLAEGGLLGFSFDGGTSGNGTVYRLEPGTTEPVVVHHFAGEPEDTRSPVSPPLLASDGRVYGLGSASVFGIDPDGGNYRFRRLFGGGGTTPSDLYGSINALTEGRDGGLYGVAGSGGAHQQGGIFRIEKSGFEITTIHAFQAGDGAPYDPVGGLVEMPDGYLHGVTRNGGTHNHGVLYRIRPTGEDLGILHHFDLTADNGVSPRTIIRGGDGVIYGALKAGGANGYGALFRYGEVPEISVEGEDGKTLTSASSVIDFGEKEWDAPTATIPVRIRNDGELALTLAEFTLTGPSAAEYAVAPPALTVLAPGESALVEIRFTPGGGGQRAALLQWASNDYDESPFSLELTALVPSPDIALFDRPDAGAEEILHGQEAAVDLGEARQGVLQGREFLIVNHGAAPLIVTRLDVPQGYRTSISLPATITPRNSLRAPIERDTLILGLASGDVVIASNDPDEAAFRFPISSNVVTPEIEVFDGITADAPELQSQQLEPAGFGEVRLQSPVTRSFLVRNTGTAALRIDRISATGGFSVTSPVVFPPVLVPGAEMICKLRIDASTLGPVAGTLTIESDDFDEPSFTFPLAGTIVAPEIAVHDGSTTGAPELVSSQSAAVDVGRHVQGTPGTRALTLSNTGTAPLAVFSITLPDGYELGAAPAWPAMLAPGATATWEIRLVSLAVGVHAGMVVVSSDDLDEASFAFPVTGEVFIPAPLVTVDIPETTLNRQTGLREQTLRVANDTTATVPATRLLIRGLPQGVTLANASDTLADGTWIVLVRRPMAPFSSFDLVLEYASANRLPSTLNPEITVEVVLEPPDDDDADAADTFAIERVMRRSEGSLLLEFSSEPGRQYAVEYSDDGIAWKSSPAVVKSAGSRTQWIDRGPPRTTTPPATQGSRFYRVRLLAD